MPLGSAFIISIHTREHGGEGVEVLTQNYFATDVWLMYWEWLSGFMSLWYVYTWRIIFFFFFFFFVGRRSVSTQLPILHHALCRSPYQKDSLYRGIFRTKCVFIPRESPCSLVQLGLRAKDLINWLILFYPLNELCAKLPLVSTKWQQTVCEEDLQILSAKLLLG